MSSLASLDEQNILTALAANPQDPLNWLALADVRLEQGDRRGELLSLHLRVRAEWDNPRREAWRERMTELLLAGVRFGLPRLTNKPGMKFALIPPGRFLMGSPPEEEERQEDEQQHEVEITRAFWLGVTPVTVGQFRAFRALQAIDTNQEMDISLIWRFPSFSQSDTHPVVNVNWDDAQEFCAALTNARPGRLFRLPSEAEWEYACRAGALETHPFHIGQPLRSLSSTQANFDGNHPYSGSPKGPYRERTSRVSSYPANGWGLYDLHGNVWEWCADWYDPIYYDQSPLQDPAGPLLGPSRVIRGGSWYNAGRSCRSAGRSALHQGFRDFRVGFRVALILPGG
jgi:formylglycine-generating enzyme required for sulfatase activity